MTPLFVYGQLKFHRYQRAAFGRTLSGTVAYLPGYDRGRIPKEYGGFFTVVEKRGKRVRGLIVELTAPELKRCDRYERGYIRHVVHLSDGSNAHVYQWKSRPKQTR